jgi:hypothetical protein
MISKYQVMDKKHKSHSYTIRKKKSLIDVLSGFLVFCSIVFLVVLVPSYSATASQCPQDISRGYYTMQGLPSFASGGLIEIRHNENVSLTLKAEDILEGNFDKKLSNGTYFFKVKPNTKATLSYKTLSHTFMMSENEKPFYIDTKQLKVVPISSKTDNTSKQLGSTPKLQSSECEYKCNKSVYAFDCNCCKGGYVGDCYGWVTCGAGWKETDCMKGNEEIYCQNNC